jgi:RNA polymerase sigma-70 factor (ECF subfamily)
MATFCTGYWYPIYVFIRRSGKSPHDAEDLTQGFFERLLAKEMLASVDPDKGKLRTFLLACVRHYLVDEWDRTQAQKRSASRAMRFAPGEAEERYIVEPVDNLTPDRLFQRRWAIAVVEQTLQLLSVEFSADGKAEIFAGLRPFLGFDSVAAKSYDELGQELGLPIGTLKSQVHRMRKRWHGLLLEQVASTLADPTPEEIRAELTELLGYV